MKKHNNSTLAILKKYDKIVLNEPVLISTHYHFILIFVVKNSFLSL